MYKKLIFVIQLCFLQNISFDPTACVVRRHQEEYKEYIEPRLTAKEFLTIELACKVQSNWPLTEFYRQVNAIGNFCTAGSELPRSKYYAKQYLKDAMSFLPQYLVFCPYCEYIFGKFDEPQKEAYCEGCKKELAPEIKIGKCQFVVLPIRKQVELYLQNDEDFRQVVTQFAKMTEVHMRGTQHGDRIEKFHLDFTLAIDGANLYRKNGRGTLPAILFFNMSPVPFK